MRTSFIVMASLALVTSVGTLAAPEQKSTAGRKADPVIVKVADAYVAATKARDAAKIAELYTEDALEMPPNQKPVQGRASIRQYYEQQFKGDTQFTDLQLQHLESRVSGDVAYDVGHYRQTITPKGGKPIEDTGNFVVVLHQAGGQWRVAYAIYNSHLPPMSSGPAKKP